MNQASKQRGFSLVETAIALGVLSFALISILGLLPSGLNQLRDSMNQTVESQILSAISSQSMVTKFDNLAGTLYFDEEGLIVEANEPGAFYKVEITPESAVFPGSENAAGSDSLMRLRVAVEAVNRPGSVRLHSLQVANYGK